MLACWNEAARFTKAFWNALSRHWALGSPVQRTARLFCVPCNRFIPLVMKNFVRHNTAFR